MALRFIRVILTRRQSKACKKENQTIQIKRGHKCNERYIMQDEENTKKLASEKTRRGEKERLDCYRHSSPLLNVLSYPSKTSNTFAGIMCTKRADDE